MAVYIKDGQTHFNAALLDYVKKGSIPVLESFLKKDNSDLTDDLGRTLLHYAAESNNVSMTQHFIDNNYDVDAEDNYGDTPLMLAVRKVSLDTAKLLIQANANMVFRDEDGNSILRSRPKSNRYRYMIDYDEWKLWAAYGRLVKIVLEKLRNDFWNDEQVLISKLHEFECSFVQAIYLGDANVTRLMLKNGYSVDEREPDTENTALHKAVQLGDFENVKVLLKHGASVDAKNKNLSSPFVFYDRSLRDVDEKVKILKILIEHGALLTPPAENRTTPTNFILYNGKLWAINTLMQYDFQWDPEYSLFALVSNNNEDVLEAVQDKKIEINSINNPMKSPVLSFAAAFGKLGKVQFLLEYGADPNALDEKGRTPLINIFVDIFARKQHLPIIRLLLQHGADAQCSFDNGTTLFDIAVRRDCRNLLDPIIAHLAMIDSRGETICDLIRCQIDSEEILKTSFEKCKQQLEMMKNTVLYESVTLHKLLTKSQSKITRYARNHDLPSKFKEAMKVQGLLNPYYSISLRKRVGKAIHLAKLKEKAVFMLNKIFEGCIKNYKEILYEIVDYLTRDDLKNVCKVYDLQESEPFNLSTLFVL